MILPQTYLNVADNSGAKKIMCIRILGNNRKSGKIGDLIIGVVKEAIPNMAIKRSNIVKALIVRTRQVINRLDGSRLKFSDNAVVLVDKDYNPVGTRIFGPIASEIRHTNFSKLISLATEIV